MAATTATAPAELTAFDNPGAVLSPYTMQPWGMLTHRGQQTVAAGIAGDQLTFTFPLPPNYVFRLNTVFLQMLGAEALVWDRSPFFRTFYAPTEVQQATDATVLDWMMIASNDDSDNRAMYGFGLDGVSGSGTAIDMKLTKPDQLMFTSIPAGVGTFDPQFRVDLSATQASAATLIFCLQWSAFSIGQRNDAVNHISLSTF